LMGWRSQDRGGSSPPFRTNNLEGFSDLTSGQLVKPHSAEQQPNPVRHPPVLRDLGIELTPPAGGDAAFAHLPSGV
jgi:hypothetical protein